MKFINIYTDTIFATKNEYDAASLKISEIEREAFYKIESMKSVKMTSIGEYSLDSSNYSIGESYPENAVAVALKKGEYVILYSKGGLVSTNTGRLNDCIKSSASDEVKFDALQLSTEELSDLDDTKVDALIKSKNYFSVSYCRFKTNGKEKLHLWVDDETVIGKLFVSIYKLTDVKNHELKSKLVTSGDSIRFMLDAGYGYDVSVSKLDGSNHLKPTPKYPVGTYQLKIFDKVGEESDILSFSQIMDRDKAKLDLHNGKVNSLKNISVPDDANPMKSYVMIGKMTLMLLIDYSNDKFYLYPVSCAECFMNLFVPDQKFVEIEKTDDHVLFAVTDYVIVAYDWTDRAEIIRSIKKWLDVSDAEIHEDAYGLYFYIDNFNLYSWYYSKFTSFVNSNFAYVKVKVTAVAFDKIDERAAEHDPIQFLVTSGTWEVSSPVLTNFNEVKWSIVNDWETTDAPNEAKAELSGTVILRISKERFDKIFGVDFDEVDSGEVTDEQFKLLSLNAPGENDEISLHKRFQYWMGIKL